MNLNNFIEDLASSKPTPGGGAAAAVVGAMAAALVSMVAGLTPGDQCSMLNAQCSILRKRFLELTEEDCRAFEAVMAAYKLPKEQGDRRQRIEEALKKATEVPLETMKLAKEVEELAQEMAEKGNPNAVSDAKSAVYLAQAAQKSAKENVEINLKSIKDEEWKRRVYG